jgi:hypothetical protein
VTPKILAVFAVTLLSACGTGAHSTAAASQAPRAVGFETTAADLRVPEVERNTDDDYVVGPIVERSEDGRASVPTYYIVRN